MSEIGKNLSQIRKQRQLTQEQLAEFINVQQSVISRWETGAVKPHLNHAIRLGRALGRAAAAAERSADAASQSALAAREAIALEKEELREEWISKIAVVLPDGKRVTHLLADLPSPLHQDWEQLVTSAARRNPRTPEEHFRKLLATHSADWESALQSRRPLPEEIGR